MWYYNYTGNAMNNRNSLRHWKYIKREKQNGKWRYWYDELTGKDKKDEYLRAKRKKEDATEQKKNSVGKLSFQKRRERKSD